MNFEIELKRTPIDDGRLLIEVIKGGACIASAPCRIDDASDRGRCVASLKFQSPALKDLEIESKMIEPLAPVGIDPIPFTTLVTMFPELREPIIDGVLRFGESCNIIAASKVGKSFLAGGLAWCVGTGRDWLGHKVKKSRVLIIDNELHPETLAGRLDAIANSMMIDEHERDEAMDVMSLRGLSIDAESAGRQLLIPSNRYGLVVIDALYRWLPKGTSENDNAQMMQIYNRIDELAREWGAAIVIVHHASKGDQTQKSTTDVGAGAGAISRAADTHLAIRPHDRDGALVLDAVTRSFKAPGPKSVKYEYPLWSVLDGVPAILKGSSRPSGVDKQKEADREGREKILKLIPGDVRGVSMRSLREKSRMGEARIKRLVGLLEDDEIVKIYKRKKKTAKQRVPFVRRVNVGCDATVETGTDSGTDSGTHKNVPSEVVPGTVRYAPL